MFPGWLVPQTNAVTILERNTQLMRIQVTLAFARLPDADLIPKATFIVASLTNNPTFPTPQPALTVVRR